MQWICSASVVLKDLGEKLFSFQEVDRKAWAQSQESTLGNSTLLSGNWISFKDFTSESQSWNRTIQGLMLNIKYKVQKGED